jgi:ElaA protein
MIDEVGGAGTVPRMDDVRFARFAELDTITLYAILRLRSAVFVVEQDCPYQDLDGRDVDPGTHHGWISESGHPVAYLRVLDEPDGTARIGRVCVAGSARRRGLAGTLMDAALADIGDRAAVLDAQTYAVDLYRGFGFVEDGPEYVEDGIPHVPMRRPPR